MRLSVAGGVRRIGFINCDTLFFVFSSNFMSKKRRFEWRHQQPSGYIANPIELWRIVTGLSRYF